MAPRKIAGAMEWYLGTLEPSATETITLYLGTGSSDKGLENNEVPTKTNKVEYIWDSDLFQMLICAMPTKFRTLLADLPAPLNLSSFANIWKFVSQNKGNLITIPRCYRPFVFY